MRATALFATALLMGCHSTGARQPGPDSEGQPAALRAGLAPSPLLAIAFAAQARRVQGRQPWELVRFGSSGDVGWALAAGTVDAGFVETAKALALLESAQGAHLGVHGALTFPYGATLVVRKGISAHLSDLPKLSIAASGPHCHLLHQLEVDVGRRGVQTRSDNFVWLPFAEMLPALEAGKVQGALMRGPHAVLAELAGHQILYQSWDVEPGDDCCPRMLAQTEYLLLATVRAASALVPLLTDLGEAADLPPVEVRGFAAAALGYSPEALAALPAGGFLHKKDELRAGLGDKARFVK